MQTNHPHGTRRNRTTDSLIIELGDRRWAAKGYGSRNQTNRTAIHAIETELLNRGLPASAVYSAPR